MIYVSRDQSKWTWKQTESFHLRIEHRLQFLDTVVFVSVYEREEKEWYTSAAFHGHAHKILHHQAGTREREREREKRERNEVEQRIEEKGRSASSACALSGCATEERIERCCARWRSLPFVSVAFSKAQRERERERGASVFFSSSSILCGVYIDLSIFSSFFSLHQSLVRSLSVPLWAAHRLLTVCFKSKKDVYVRQAQKKRNGSKESTTSADQVIFWQVNCSRHFIQRLVHADTHARMCRGKE